MRVWKDNAIRRDYTAQKHMENHEIDRDEIPSARVQCGNRSPLRFSSSLSVWLNVSLSSFSASLSLSHFPRISLFSLSFSLPLYSNLLRKPLPLSLSRSAHVSFLVLSTLSSFSAKFNPQFSLRALLYFPFVKSTKSFVLLLPWRSGSVNVKDISSHALHKNLSDFLTLIFNNDKTKWEL